ncbi:MAG: hypothetical protein J6S67_14890 [Methanobrevibacter sp.]|nr:hypothetical protein [Methanobrevibacter sp.]
MKKTTKLVKTILRDYPIARDSDYYLYIRVMKELNPKACEMKFEEVFTNLKELGLPLYDSVSRARRKLQAEFPELQGSDKVKDFRTEREEEFREYARS